MSGGTYTALTDEQLVAEFERRAVAQSAARTVEGHNQNIQATFDIRDELSRRGEESLRKLLPLIHHTNASVRLDAAVDCYALALKECLPVLVELASRQNDIVGIHAGFFLMANNDEFRARAYADYHKQYGPWPWERSNRS